jgi:hypothetical protein
MTDAVEKVENAAGAKISQRSHRSELSQEMVLMLNLHHLAKHYFGRLVGLVSLLGFPNRFFNDS